MRLRVVNEILLVDESLFKWVNSWSGIPLIDTFMVFVSAHETWVIVFILWILSLIKMNRPKIGKLILGLGVVIGLTDLFSFEVLKPQIGRLRPCYALEEVHIVQGKCGGDFGFPSNHAANAGATVAFLMFLYGKKAFWALGVALIVCLSRVYLGVHYPLDVMGGLILGFGMGTSILRFGFRKLGLL